MVRVGAEALRDIGNTGKVNRVVNREVENRGS